MIASMRILLVGAGGVGAAFARVAARRSFAELVIADYDLGRAQRAAAARDGYEAVQLDASDLRAVADLLTQRRCDVLMNATDPRFGMPLFRAALQAGTHYLDMAMSLSYPHPDDPYHQTGVKLGDEQFAMATEWERSGKLALVRSRRARPRGAAIAAVPRPADRLRLAVGLPGAHAPRAKPRSRRGSG
jgi:saccharopine dehydrogenase-like NADP-dependent oxidoreductase